MPNFRYLFVAAGARVAGSSTFGAVEVLVVWRGGGTFQVVVEEVCFGS